MALLGINYAKQAKYFMCEPEMCLKSLIYETLKKNGDRQLGDGLHIKNQTAFQFIQTLSHSYTHTHTHPPTFWHPQTFHESVLSSWEPRSRCTARSTIHTALSQQHSSHAKTSLGETDELASRSWPLEKTLFTLRDKSQGWWCRGSVVVGYYTHYTTMN